MGQRQFVCDQAVDFNLHRGIALSAQHQRQPKARKAVQKHQTQARRQPRHHDRPFDAPEGAPGCCAQRACRSEPGAADLFQRLDSRSHQQAQVEKQVAIQQHPGRFLQFKSCRGQWSTKPAARTPQRQHTQSGHQRRHDKRQHQQTQHPFAACKLPASQHPGERHTQYQG